VPQSLRLAAIVLVTAPLAAAQPPPSPPRGALAESVEVRTLEIGVRVENRNGEAIRGLDRDQFEVRLDRGLTRVQAVTEIADEQLEDLLLVIVVDHRSLAASDRDAALRELDRELDTLLAHARPTIAVASLDDTLEVVQPPTTDSARAKLALQGQQGKESRSGGRGLFTVEQSARTSLEEVLRELRGNRRDRVVAMASIDSLIGEFRGYAQALHRETELELQALRGFVRSLGVEPGRTAIVFLSAGLPLRPLGALMQTLQDSLSGGSTASSDTVDATPSGSELTASSPMISTANDGGVMQRDVSHELMRLQQTVDAFQSHDSLEALIAEANTGRVSFYTARPRPAQASTAQGRDAGRGATLEISDEKALLADLATGTAGWSRLGEGGLGGFLAALGSDFEHYYSLSIEPPVATGERVELDVRVKARGARTRAPQALILPRRVDQRLEDRTLAALGELPQQNPHQVELVVARQEALPGSAGRHVVELELTLPIGAIGLRAVGEAYRTEARVAVAVVAGADGLLLESQHLQLPLEIPARDLEQAREQYYKALIRLELPAGEHRLSLGLWDEVSGSSSYLGMSLVVGARQ
jgi:VWFA-related protein